MGRVLRLDGNKVEEKATELGTSVRHCRGEE
jgi:hypothetical protein